VREPTLPRCVDTPQRDCPGCPFIGNCEVRLEALRWIAGRPSVLKEWVPVETDGGEE